MTAAQDADDPLALAGAAWTTPGMVQRSAGDTDGALGLGVEIARAYHQRRDYPATLH
jgi:hypothetical protein